MPMYVVLYVSVMPPAVSVIGVLICLQAAQGGVRRARHAIVAIGDAIGDVTAERWKADLAYGSADFGFRCFAVD